MLGRHAKQGTITFCKAKKAASSPKGDCQELERGREKKLHPFFLEKSQSFLSVSVERTRCRGRCHPTCEEHSTLKSSPIIPSKKKLQKAERDTQSSRSTSTRLVLLLPHPTNPNTKSTMLSRASSLIINTAKQLIIWGGLPGLDIQDCLGFRQQKVSHLLS